MSAENSKKESNQTTTEIVSSLVGRPWAEINYIIQKNKEDGLFIEQLHTNKDFEEYCHKQAQSFLKFRVALTKKDIHAAEILWLYGNLEYDELMEIKNRLETQNYVVSDRFRDFDNDKNLQLLADNIPDIQEELDMPEHIALSMRREQRQKLVDYVRFMEGGKRSREMIEKENWKFLADEYNSFPRAKTEFIIELYKKEEEKNPHSARLDMISRLFIYRLYDINDGIWKVKSKDEIEVLENFIRESINNPEEDKLYSAVLNNINEARKALEEKKSTPLVINEETDEESVLVDELIKTEGKEEKTVVEQEKIEGNSVSAQEDADKSKKDDTDKKTESVETEESRKENEDNWQDKVVFGWKNWARENKKIVKTYSLPSEENSSLNLRVYSNKEAVEKEDFEADIKYKNANEMSVKGKDGKIPDINIFEGIVANAKKVSKQISFGDIKSDEFKAKLMVACMKDPEIEMLNAPKVEELKDISEELKTALESLQPNKIEEVKDKRQKLDAEKENRDNKPKRRHRKYTDAERQAYQQKRREKMNNTH